MCSNCSSYSGHTGICPACRKEEFEEELSKKQSEFAQTNKTIFWYKVYTVLLCWTIIGIPIGIYHINKQQQQATKLYQRIDYLGKEIAKLSKALTQGSATI